MVMIDLKQEQEITSQEHRFTTGFGGVTVRDSIGVYSFALKPKNTVTHQELATSQELITQDLLQPIMPTAQALNVYAVNYNVLRVMSGMGGLAYL